MLTGSRYAPRGLWIVTTIALVLMGQGNSVFSQEVDVEVGEQELSLREQAPHSLDSLPIPEAKGLSRFVRDRDTAILLGKALFWDIQAGSDGRTSCASCHFHAGADSRTRNTLNPGAGGWSGPDYAKSLSDYPFHKKVDPARKGHGSDNVARDTGAITGSQGVIKRNFVGLSNRYEDLGRNSPDEVFTKNGVNVRQATGRNAPTVVNAVFNDRQFWDGRGNRFFNGINPFGDTDPNASLWSSRRGHLNPVQVQIENASLASQAVGPILNEVEMSWFGRSFPEVGRKLLNAYPLECQVVSKTDSVLGAFTSNRHTFGLRRDITYASLIQQAFQPEWWDSRQTVDGEYTQMEANFSLYWGLSIMLYEATLVSDDTPFDRWAKGDDSALTAQQLKGLKLFLNEGKCINCHKGPEFAGAQFSEIRGVLSPEVDPIEFMQMGFGGNAFYDNGFYNIGVRPTEEDPGVGGGRTDGNGQFIPFAITRRNQEGIFPDESHVEVSRNARIAVNGAFKTPTLRNIELTGPYMHNGGMATLEQVVEFYARGGDFENRRDRDPDVDGIDEIRGDKEQIAALVAFLKALTDERVRNQAAPFDHPELWIPNGVNSFSSRGATDEMIHLPATGASGGAPLKTFEDILKQGGQPALR